MSESDRLEDPPTPETDSGDNSTDLSQVPLRLESKRKKKTRVTSLKPFERSSHKRQNRPNSAKYAATSPTETSDIENELKKSPKIRKAINISKRKMRSLTVSDKRKLDLPFLREVNTVSNTAEESCFVELELSEMAKANPKQKQRELIINEILQTERQYVDDLNLIVDEFLGPLKNHISKESIHQIFGNIEVIRDINSDVLRDLTARIEEKGNHDILVGDVFLNLYNYFRLYTMYCIEQENAMKMHKQLLLESIDYENCLRTQKQNPKCRQLDLPDLLIKPMQRLCKYPLLLRELLNRTENDHPDYENLNTAMEQVSNVVKYINERKRLGENQQKIVDIQQSIENCPSLLQVASRKFIRTGDINLIETNKSRKVIIHLFNDALLIAKPKKQKVYRSEYYASSFLTIFLLKDTRIVDVGDVGASLHSFEISSKEDSLKKYLLRSRSLEEKRNWLKDIKGIIKDFQYQDFKANKEALLKDSETREKLRQDLLSLNQREVNPTKDDNADVWTMGLVLWQMYTQKPLFPGLSFEQAAVALLHRKIPPSLDDTIPPELREILEDCWLENPDIRPNFAMIYDRIRALDCKPKPN